MADQLPPIGTQQMTATEINTRVEIIRQQLGPLYGRLQSEFLMPLLDRCFGLALRSGVLPPPPRELWVQTFHSSLFHLWHVLSV